MEKQLEQLVKKVEKGNIPYIVSGFLGGLGISIGQVKVDDKSNEITAIPDLLDLINIEGCTVTIDAIGTQTKIVEKIINKKGNYCLSVKENQCSLYEDIKAYFDFALDDEVETKNIKQYTTEEKDHGRYEKRKYYISDNLFYVNDAKKWKGLVAIGYVDRLRDVNGEIEKSKNYYILSKSLDSEEFGECVRGHWAIENKLHWVLDVIFNEDHSTSKKDRAIENISIIRKIVFNLTKLDPQMAKKSTKKKIIDYTFDFSNFKRLIYEVIPSSTTL